MTTTAAATNIVAELAGRLRIAAGRIARDGSSQTRVDGMTPSRIAALSVLQSDGPLRMGELADRMGVSAPTASRLAECLAARGMIERVPDPDDHRATRLRLSASGEDGLTAVRERGTGLLADRIAALSGEELQVLADAMDVLEKLSCEIRPVSSGPAEPR